MDAHFARSGRTLAIVGIVMTAAAPLAGALVESARIRGSASLLTTFGLIVLLVGCFQIARAKAQPWYVGLLGLLSFVGVLILWYVVPDRAE